MKRKSKSAKSSYKQQYYVAHKKVNSFFKDKIKATLWMTCKNPALGDISPIEMLLIGRVDKLMKFISTQLEENK